MVYYFWGYLSPDDYATSLCSRNAIWRWGEADLRICADVLLGVRRNHPPGHDRLGGLDAVAILKVSALTISLEGRLVSSKPTQ